MSNYVTEFQKNSHDFQNILVLARRERANIAFSENMSDMETISLLGYDMVRNSNRLFNIKLIKVTLYIDLHFSSSYNLDLANQ